MFYQFLLYNNVNQLYAYIYPLPHEPPSHSPIPPSLEHLACIIYPSDQCQHQFHCLHAQNKYIKQEQVLRHFLSIKPALTGDKQSYLWHFHILDKFFHHVLSCVQSFFATLCNRIGLQPTRLLCLWDFSGRNTGVGYHFLLRGIFLTQGSNPWLLCLLHCRKILYQLSHGGTPSTHVFVLKVLSIQQENGQ